ncbi:MAG: ATP-dependent DNA helicase RecG [Candidatus Puniceispirillaceae bacterium]
MHITRPPLLYPLFAETTSLDGIGARLAGLLEKRIEGRHVMDLLRHLPVGLIDRRARPAIPMARDGQIAVFELRITKHDMPPAKTRRPARIYAENETGEIELVYFHARPDYLSRLLPVGGTRLISGRVEHFNGRVQMMHPDFVLPLDKAGEMPEIEPVYPLTAGITSRVLRRAIVSGLTKLPARDKFPEWIDKGLMATRDWPDFTSASAQVHHPERASDLEPTALARQRLAYDELLANQLALVLLREATRKIEEGAALPLTGRLKTRLIESLAFALTHAQSRTIEEIETDLAADVRMLRLLQGDVGSGKTMVALIAMLHVAEAGGQAALLAPTEILARQHHRSLNKMLAPLGLSCGLLLGAQKAAERREIEAQLANGEIQMVVGTHALITERIAFADLRLAVIDEQHRFGVRQRLMLSEKGKAVDMLVMTATPIPRTLAMTAYGDLQSSALDEKPAGRQPIETAVLHHDKIAAIIDRLRQVIATGQRAYWICPLVEESEKLDVAAAEDRFAHLQKLLPEVAVRLAHGKMKPEERETAMADFANGTAQLLVATTVIEVGVDVPEAGIIIIEHADRFGLAQLHQLRGRVGRGTIKSSCLLLHDGQLSETARQRLSIMRQTNDGFLIAEEDLKLRGPGEVLGQRQSGLSQFKLADLSAHADLIAIARRQAQKIAREHPNLAGEEAEAYRLLLSLFEKDNAVKFLASG